jgi:hypothetical protein
MKVCDHIHKVIYMIIVCGDNLTVTVMVYQSSDRDSERLMW